MKTKSILKSNIKKLFEYGISLFEKETLYEGDLKWLLHQCERIWNSTQNRKNLPKMKEELKQTLKDKFEHRHWGF